MLHNNPIFITILYDAYHKTQHWYMIIKNSKPNSKQPICHNKPWYNLSVLTTFFTYLYKTFPVLRIIICSIRLWMIWLTKYSKVDIFVMQYSRMVLVVTNVLINISNKSNISSSYLWPVITLQIEVTLIMMVHDWNLVSHIISYCFTTFCKSNSTLIFIHYYIQLKLLRAKCE